MRVLIVDGSEDVRALLRRVVSMEDQVAGVVNNGEDAISAYRGADPKPDLVLMANTMILMTGIEALVEIRKEFPDASIVICTSDPVKDEAMEAGAIEFLQKPYTLKKLRSVLKTVRDNL